MPPRSPIPQIPLLPGTQFTPTRDERGQAIAGLGRAVSGAGQQVSRIAAKRQAVADSTEATLSFLKGADDINKFNRDLSFDVDPDKHSEKFGQGFDQIVKKLIESASNSRVQRMLTERFAQFRVGQIDQARAKQNEVFIRDKKARIDNTEEELTREAAILFTEERTNVDPTTGIGEIEERPVNVHLFNEKLTAFTDLIGGLDGSVYARGEGEQRARGAQQRILSARVRAEIRENPNEFLEDIAENKVLIGTPGNELDISDALPQEEIESLSTFARQTREKIRIRDARRAAKADKDFDETVKVIKRSMISQAIGRTLPAHILQQIAEDKHPHLSPAFALTLQRILDNPIIGGDSQSVLAHAQAYRSGPRTQTRINKARDGMLKLIDETGLISKAASTFLDELQADEFSITTREATRINQASTIAVRRYLNLVGKSIFGGAIGKMSENKKRLNRAEIERRVRNGEDGNTVVDEIIARDEEESRRTIRKGNREVIDLLNEDDENAR